MKRIATFVIGFMAVAIPAANYLAGKDPEPDMAGLSLLFLWFFGLLASLGIFAWSAARAHASPYGILTFCTGVVCAACFCGALGLIPVGLGFASAMALSFALFLFFVWASTFLSRAGA
jgi:hypothetical protein